MNSLYDLKKVEGKNTFLINETRVKIDFTNFQFPEISGAQEIVTGKIIFNIPNSNISLQVSAI